MQIVFFNANDTWDRYAKIIYFQISNNNPLKRQKPLTPLFKEKNFREMGFYYLQLNNYFSNNCRQFNKRYNDFLNYISNNCLYFNYRKIKKLFYFFKINIFY